jgi:hypothetical protein
MGPPNQRERFRLQALDNLEVTVDVVVIVAVTAEPNHIEVTFFDELSETAESALLFRAVQQGYAKAGILQNGSEIQNSAIRRNLIVAFPNWQNE